MTKVEIEKLIAQKEDELSELRCALAQKAQEEFEEKALDVVRFLFESSNFIRVEDYDSNKYDIQDIYLDKTDTKIVIKLW